MEIIIKQVKCFFFKDYPQATNASEVTLDDSSVTVTREIDGGLQTLKLNKPAIVTTDLRLNERKFLPLTKFFTLSFYGFQVDSNGDINYPSIGLIVKC